MANSCLLDVRSHSFYSLEYLRRQVGVGGWCVEVCGGVRTGKLRRETRKGAARVIFPGPFKILALAAVFAKPT